MTASLKPQVRAGAAEHRDSPKIRRRAKLHSAAVAGMLLFLGAAPAAAAIIPFNATRTNAGTAPIADGVCAPQLTLQFDPGAPTFNQGTSNLGDFDATISECLAGPPPAPNSNSPWLFEFDNGTLFGIKSGNPTGPIEGGFGFQSAFTIAGGTGFFSGATGQFTGVGNVVFGRTPLAIETLTGMIDVPEPASGMLLLGGLALAGWARRRARLNTRSQAA